MGGTLKTIINYWRRAVSGEARLNSLGPLERCVARSNGLIISSQSSELSLSYLHRRPRISRLAPRLRVVTLVAAGLSLSGTISGSPAPRDVLNPVPVATNLQPYWVRAGQGAITLTVSGSNLLTNSIVYFGEVARPTIYVSATELSASIPASDLSSRGVASIKVITPPPGGGESSALDFRILSAMPATVYVDDDYRQWPADARVSFPDNGATGEHIVGYDAFGTVQGGIDAVVVSGVVRVAAGTYSEHVTIGKSLSLSGPNAGRAGADPGRSAEAELVMDIDDPESTPVIAVEASDVTIEGLLIDGANTNCAGGYSGQGTRLNAAAGVQNGVYDLGLADFDHLTVRNCLIRNVSYDGIYLDRADYLTQSSAYNLVVSNKFENMWEGLLTYGVETVIEGNTFTNLVHGLSVHAGLLPVPSDFEPRIASNHLTIGEWFPEEIPVTNAPGIWINNRRAKTTLQVVGNRIDTPIPAPVGRRLIGFYALNIGGDSSVNFQSNEIHGSGHCNLGAFVAGCPAPAAVRFVGNILGGIKGVGVLARTRDWTWGAGDCALVVSNVSIELASAVTGVGVQVCQDSECPTNSVNVAFVGDSTVRSAAVGLQVIGRNAGLVIRNNAAPVAGNAIGMEIDGGKATIENNNLEGNTVAAIHVLNQAVVDAGNCRGLNLTGLGPSAGQNRFNGYFGTTAKAIINSSSNGPAVSAQNNDFGAIAGQNIGDALIGSVDYSQVGPLLLGCPEGMEALACRGDVQPAANDLPSFIALGGSVSASAASVVSADRIVTNGHGRITITRAYTITDDFCSKTGRCEQCFQVIKSAPPAIVCPGPIVTIVDAGKPYATVNFAVSAADACGEVGVTTAPWVSGDHFPLGTNWIVATATDDTGWQSTCSFCITVTDRPVLSVPELVGASCQLTVQGVAGTNVVLEVSQDLVQWTPLQTNQVPFLYTETNDCRLTGRFFRARYDP